MRRDNSLTVKNRFLRRVTVAMGRLSPAFMTVKCKLTAVQIIKNASTVPGVEHLNRDSELLGLSGHQFEERRSQNGL